MADADLMVKVRADIKDLQTKMSKVNKELDKTSKESKKAAKESNKLNAGFGALKKAAGTLAVAYGAIKSAKVAKDMVVLGAEIQSIRKSFNNLSSSVGTLSSSLLTELSSATMGTVDNLNLMKNANQAMLLGIDVEALPSMFSGALSAAQATGQPVQKAIEDITTGIGRQSKMILDNLGILVNVESAQKKYAESLGKTSAELSEQEKKAAFTSEAMEQLAFNSLRIGSSQDDLTIKVEQLNTAFTNLKNSVAEGAAIVFDRMVDANREWFESMGLLPEAIDENMAKLQALVEASKSTDIAMVELSDGVRVTESAFNKARDEADNIIDTLLSMPDKVSAVDSLSLINFRNEFIESSAVISDASGKVASLKEEYIRLGGSMSDLLEPSERSITQSERMIEAYDEEISALAETIRQNQEKGRLSEQEKERLDELKKKKDAELKAIEEKHKRLKELPGLIEAEKQKIAEAQPTVDKMKDTTVTWAKNLTTVNEELATKFPEAVDKVIEAGQKINGNEYQFKIIQLVETHDTLMRGGKIVGKSKISFSPSGYRQEGGIIHAQAGIKVPGQGTGDKVPAMLEPGEFVLNKKAVNAVGLDNLQNINTRFPRFQAGGFVGGNGDLSSGTIVVNIENINGGDATSIAEALQEQLQEIIST